MADNSEPEAEVTSCQLPPPLFSGLRDLLGACPGALHSARGGFGERVRGPAPGGRRLGRPRREGEPSCARGAARPPGSAALPGAAARVRITTQP